MPAPPLTVSGLSSQIGQEQANALAQSQGFSQSAQSLAQQGADFAQRGAPPPAIPPTEFHRLSLMNELGSLAVGALAGSFLGKPMIGAAASLDNAQRSLAAGDMENYQLSMQRWAAENKAYLERSKAREAELKSIMDMAGKDTQAASAALSRYVAAGGQSARVLGMQNSSLQESLNRQLKIRQMQAQHEARQAQLAQGAERIALARQKLAQGEAKQNAALGGLTPAQNALATRVFGIATANGIKYPFTIYAAPPSMRPRVLYDIAKQYEGVPDTPAGDERIAQSLAKRFVSGAGLQSFADVNGEFQQQVAAANTVIAHLQSLRDYSRQHSFTDFPELNKWAQAAGFQAGSTLPTTLAALQTNLGAEYAQAMGVRAQQGRDQMGEIFAPSLSQPQRVSNINEVIRLLAQRVAGLAAQAGPRVSALVQSRATPGLRDALNKYAPGMLSGAAALAPAPAAPLTFNGMTFTPVQGNGG